MAIEDATHDTGENPSGPFVMLVNADGTPFTGYADFDGEGHLAGMHPHDVGSC